MGDENVNQVSSSQETLILSQETFNILWDEVNRDWPLQLFDENLDNSHFDNGSITETTFNVETVAVEPIVVQADKSSSNPHYIPSSLPASQNWPGEYDFTVSFGPQDKNTKGVTWTYSKIKDKLYVGKDVPCPINFSANAYLPSDVRIRAMSLYSSPENASEIVTRCINHSMDEMKNELVEAQHLVRCESSMATYETDDITKRHSTVIPFENPPVGQKFSTYIFKFACFGSCAGGPNRRPLMLIFSLEKEGRVIGHRKMDVKICACPGRDRKAEEKMLMESEGGRPVPLKRKESEQINLAEVLNFTKYITVPQPKKAKLSHSPNGSYTITVEDEGCYDFLRQMRNFYRMCKAMKDVPPHCQKI